MCEQFHGIEQNNNKRPVTPTNVVVEKHKHIQDRITEIHQKEVKQQVADFVELNRTELDSDRAAHYIEVYVTEMLSLDPAYNIWDEDITEIKKVITLYEQNDLYKKEASIAKKENKIAFSLKNHVLQEKETGKSNLQIIQSILDQQKEGSLSIPKHKIDQYQKILALSDQIANTPDQNYIQEIINSSETSLLDEGSFENIVFRVYEDERISDQTKTIIEQQFKIEPIQTGGDLKRALEDRNKLIIQHENQLNQLNDELLVLDKKEQSLQQQLDKLKIQLESTTDLEKREELYQQIHQVETQVKLLQDEKEEKSLVSNTLKQKKPNDTVVLREYNAKLKGGLIKIKNPINGHSVRIPIQADNEKIGMIANSLFLRQIIEPMGGENLIFTGERFQDSDLPTFTMLPFSNEILAALHIGNSGNILTKSELKILESQFKRLQNPNNLTYLKSSEEGMKEDFKALGLLDGSVLIKHKFLNLLESLHSQPDLEFF